jgi:hypothetical protein
MNVRAKAVSSDTVVVQRWVTPAGVTRIATLNFLVRRQVHGHLRQLANALDFMVILAAQTTIVIQRLSVGINIQLMYKTISRDALTSIPRIRGLTLDGIHKLETLLMMPLSMGSFVQPAGLGTPMKEIPRNALK